MKIQQNRGQVLGVLSGDDKRQAGGGAQADLAAHSRARGEGVAAAKKGWARGRGRGNGQLHEKGCPL